MRKILAPLFALLLVGASGMMTAEAQSSGKPKLAVFVVGISDELINPLATQIGNDLNRSSQYDVLPSANNAVANKLTELRAAHTAGSIDRNALATWGRANGVSTICLVVDNISGNDHMFSAQLIDAKDSKLSGKGSYIRTNVVSGDISRVSSALAQQMRGQGRRRSTSAPAHSYPAEVDIEMVFVEGGTFTMGCQDGECYDGNRELPVHAVMLSSFRIGKYEVTQAQWNAVMAGTSYENIFLWKGNNCGNVPCDDQRPAENMSWDEAMLFCNTLSEKSGLTKYYTINGSNNVTLNANATGYRLPTEAQWEYAARGCKGGKCDDYKYSGSDDLSKVAWSAVNARNTHPVGQMRPNGLGIYDMSGNVWELCWDFWASGYSWSGATNANTTGPASGTFRTVRGGDWNIDVAGYPRVAIRYYNNASARWASVGLRVVLPAQ
ncbi:MAG: formylglycine-generating enzyme family protein [Prevotellaceae bacterium]|jgi:formylglycine-generating enzyme required for sulfatase activity|nr:formylglycine-generating enzyme family protein [Prevotellaceae bacterium]